MQIDVCVHTGVQGRVTVGQLGSHLCGVCVFAFYLFVYLFDGDREGGRGGAASLSVHTEQLGHPERTIKLLDVLLVLFPQT